jgi:site-specific recombinase XerD
MRDEHAPLLETIDSFLVHRHDLSHSTATNYRFAITTFAKWVQEQLERPAELGDLKPGTVEAFLTHRRTTASAQCARSAWVALRSFARFLAERRIHHENGESTFRLVRMPKVKDEARRALTDREMWLLIERASEGELAQRDSAIVWTMLGCGLRREELVGLRLEDVDAGERRLHVRAATSKSIRPRDVTIPIETLKALDSYVLDHRVGADEREAPLFTDPTERRSRATPSASSSSGSRSGPASGTSARTCSAIPGRRTFIARARDPSSTCRSRADGRRDGWSSGTARHDPSRNAAKRRRLSPHREPRSQRRGLQRRGPHSREAACTENGSRSDQ